MDLSNKKFASDGAYLAHVITTAEKHVSSLNNAEDVDIEHLRNFYFVTDVLLKRIGRHLFLNDSIFFIMKGELLDNYAKDVKAGITTPSSDKEVQVGSKQDKSTQTGEAMPESTQTDEAMPEEEEELPSTQALE